jgi:hypothetical protein
MQTIAIGGLKYPIDSWLPPTVVHYRIEIMGQWHLIHQLKRSIGASPLEYRLIGFSRGASIAVALFDELENVVETYAHSCGRIPFLQRSAPRRRTGLLRFFRTEGDSMGQVYQQTGRIREEYRRLGHRDCILRDLPFSPISRPIGVIQLSMNNNRHVFHNCLPHLPLQL